MTALTAAARESMRHAFSAQAFRDASNPATITKAELLAAVAAVDDWLEANATALNQAIPQPARGALSVAQKAQILSLVAMARFGG